MTELPAPKEPCSRSEVEQMINKAIDDKLSPFTRRFPLVLYLIAVLYGFVASLITIFLIETAVDFYGQVRWGEVGAFFVLATLTGAVVGSIASNFFTEKFNSELKKRGINTTTDEYLLITNLGESKSSEKK
jgi:hypothetical protein